MDIYILVLQVECVDLMVDLSKQLRQEPVRIEEISTIR